MLRHRNAKIIATLGPASATPERIAALFEAGPDVFPLNFSHGPPEEHRAHIDVIRALEKTIGRPVVFSRARMTSMCARCSSGGPWLKLRGKTSGPASNSAAMRSGVALAGPSVAMILALRWRSMLRLYPIPGPSAALRGST